MLRVLRLRCEHMDNPIGIGETRPRFGWVMGSDHRNVFQEAYHIQVDTEGDFKKPLWDSGIKNSSESAYVEYEGPELESSTRYYYRVRIWDNHGNESLWSETAFFETAMFHIDEWKAQFISPEGEEEGDSSAGGLLRKDFKLDGEVEFARVYATALGMYELCLNGQRLGDGVLTPGWTEYRERLQYQTYDVTDILKDGDNAIGASLGAGWYKGDLAGWIGRRNIYGDRMGLLLQILIRYADGREEIIASDNSFKVSRGPILYSELYHGETYDARKEEKDWDMPDFNDDHWQNAAVMDIDLGNLVPQDGVMVTRQEVLNPKTLFKTPKGELVMDFGQNMAGWVKFNVRGKAGDRVVLKHAEVLDAQGNFYTENLRAAKSRIEYILKGEGTETFEPHFTFQGFRYIMIEEYPGEVDMEDFKAIVIHSDMKQIGRFSCSNELVNKLHHNILWGLKGNFVDIPTDCPQRDERLGWTGDAQVFMKAACYLMDVRVFFQKWFRDMRVAQLENGGIPYVIPDVLTDATKGGDPKVDPHSATGWGDAATICPWTLYQTYGDGRILNEQYDTMKGWVEYIRSKAQDGVIWNTGFHYGDWVALDAKEGDYIGATPVDLIATAYYAYSTELLIKSAKVLGKGEDVKEYTSLHKAIVKAFRDEFYTPRGRLAAPTQTAHILSLMFGLTPEDCRERTVEDLVKLLDEYDGHLATGFLGTPYFCHVLSQNGRLNEAYELLLKEDYPSWLYQVKKGATTIWEHWDGIKPDGSMWSSDMNSFNHYAYGAIGDWLYGVVAGIDTDPDMPGFKRIIMRPQPGGGLTYAEAEYMTPYGKAAIKWEIEDGHMWIDIIIPHNTRAHIVLPQGTLDSFEGDGVGFRLVGNNMEAEIGSGNYRFSYPYN